VIHTFDDLQSGNAVTGIRNTVYSVDYDVTILDKNNMSLNLLGESGRSKVGRAERVTDADGKEENVMLSEEDDTFMDVGLTFKLKKEKLTISDAEKIEAWVDGAFLSEIRGQGTFELKNFSLIKAATNINIHQFLDWENSVRATLGLQLESTERGGGEIEEVDLNSTLVDLGLEVEIFPEFDLLLGAKLFNSEGRDYIPVLTGFNEVQDFPTPFVADDQETMLGLGIKYEFKKDIYLTLQYNHFNSELGADNPNNYEFQQFFVLYNMEF